MTTVITAARTGARVVRHLIKPAQRLPSARELGQDPWLPRSTAQVKLERGASLTRRGLGLLTLLGLTIAGFMILGLTVVMLGIGVASGSQVAGWLLAFTLIAGLVGLVWTGRRAFNLLSPPPAPAAPLHEPSAVPDGEQTLLNLLHTQERALPASLQTAFRTTVIATRDAMRVTARENTLSRAAFDARQAAHEDLPELLDAYRSVPPSAQSDAQLLEQLQVIQARMQDIMQTRGADGERRLNAHGQYLEDKYGHTPQTVEPIPLEEPVR